MTEQQWITLASHVARGLRAVGKEVSVENIRQQLDAAEAAMRTTTTDRSLAEYDAPNPWKLGGVETTPLRNDCAPPDPWAAGIKAMREASR